MSSYDDTEYEPTAEEIAQQQQQQQHQPVSSLPQQSLLQHDISPQ